MNNRNSLSTGTFALRKIKVVWKNDPVIQKKHLFAEKKIKNATKV